MLMSLYSHVGYNTFTISEEILYPYLGSVYIAVSICLSLCTSV